MPRDPFIIYAWRERPLMRRFQRTKDRLLRPLLATLETAGLTPTGLSIASAVTAVAGLAASVIWQTPVAFIIGIWLHMILDGLDGPLARRRAPSRYGSLIDSSADFVGIASSAAYLGILTNLPTGLPLAYCLLYAIVVLLIIARNAMRQPYLLLIRPRLFIYTTLTIDAFLPSPLLAWSLWLSITLLAATTIAGAITIISQLWRPSFYSPNKEC